jgi:hypothetical protein
MANWDNTTARLQSARDATNLPQLYRALYSQAKLIQSALALYQAGSDPPFNAAVNALLTSAERTELNVMANQVNALASDWETNHAGAIQQ